MTDTQEHDYKAIDAVVNIWTEEALSHRPDWGDEFFVDKMNTQSALMAGLSLEEMILMRSIYSVYLKKEYLEFFLL